MNAKAPQQPPTADELKALVGKPTPSPAPPLPEVLRREMASLPAGYKQAFPVRVALVCPHCSSYMQRLGGGDLMTCKTERCPNHLKRFRLPVLIAEEVEA